MGAISGTGTVISSEATGVDRVFNGVHVSQSLVSCVVGYCLSFFFIVLSVLHLNTASDSLFSIFKVVLMFELEVLAIVH